MNQVSELIFLTVVVKAGSLSAAARELGVTPSSVSKRLAQMEQRLGVQLLNRTTRRLSLTDEGVTKDARFADPWPQRSPPSGR